MNFGQLFCIHLGLLLLIIALSSLFWRMAVCFFLLCLEKTYVMLIIFCIITFYFCLCCELQILVCWWEKTVPPAVWISFHHISQRQTFCTTLPDSNSEWNFFAQIIEISSRRLLTCFAETGSFWLVTWLYIQLACNESVINLCILPF